MKLQAEDGTTFELHLLRYEHPDVTEDLWDSNWLVISGRVAHGERSWRFVEPCATTFELEQLADWLQSLGAQPADLAFAEPNLAFAYLPWPRPVLQIRFAAGSAPPELADEERASGVTIDFLTSPDQAQRLAADLRAILVDYPTRGGAA